MKRNAFAALFLGLLLISGAEQAPAQVPAASQTLTPIQTGVPSARYFGQSFASNSEGTLLAVGAPYYLGATGDTSPGAVLMFLRTGSAWTFLYPIQAPTPTNGDGFGYHVTFMGDEMLVGAVSNERRAKPARRHVRLSLRRIRG